MILGRQLLASCVRIIRRCRLVMIVSETDVNGTKVLTALQFQNGLKAKGSRNMEMHFNPTRVVHQAWARSRDV